MKLQRKDVVYLKEEIRKDGVCDVQVRDQTDYNVYTLIYGRVMLKVKNSIGNQIYESVYNHYLDNVHATNFT